MSIQLVGAPKDVEGLSNQKFFDETGAGYHAPDTTKDNIITPEFYSLSEAQEFRKHYLRYRHFFGLHIDYTVPGYEEFLVLSGLAIAKTMPVRSSILYQGASDGRLGKAITAYGHTIGKDIHTKSLTSSITNLNGFCSTPHVEGAVGILQAFSEKPGKMMDPVRYYDPEKGSYGCLVSYAPVTKAPKPPKAPDGKFYPGTGHWTPDAPFDCIISYVLYQFCGRNRSKQIRVSKSHTTKDALYVFVEKFNPESDEEETWMFRERAKDLWKQQFFSAEEIREKKETVLAKMQGFQVTRSDFESALRKNFRHAKLIGNSANFFAYAASDSGRTLNTFMENFPVLPHPYTFVDCPLTIC